MNNALLKRFLSVVMAVAMVMSMVVIPVAADEADGGNTPVACTEAEGCTAESHNTSCPAHPDNVAPTVETVCNGADGCTLTADVQGHIEGCEAAKPAEKTAVDETSMECTCEVRCNEQAAEDCAVCAADPDKCTGKTVEEIEAEQKAAADAAKVKIVNDLIAALPETVTAENYESVKAQLTTIMGHQESMGELWSKVDQAKLDAAIQATQIPASIPDDIANTNTLDNGYAEALSNRNRIYMEIQNPSATSSIVIKLYSDTTLLSTTTYKAGGYTGSILGVNIVVRGEASSSWNTVWEAGQPNANNVPNRAELYIDNAATASASNTITMYKPDSPNTSTVQWADLTKPSGAITLGYTSQTAVWGEGKANASESFVVELYAGETKIGQTSLNNIGGIIDGDVYVTWSIPFAGSTDGYWTATWEEGHPNKNTQPNKVVLIVDGTKVAENNVQMNGPDNLNPVTWADLDFFKEPSATIGHGLQTIVDASKPRESVTTTLENVHAKNELKVELYSAGTLLSTTTLRQADLDDATAKYPANGEYTVNIVLSGQASGSWDTTWHVTPTASNIPDTIKVYADGELKDTKTNTDGYFLNATEKSKYLALGTLIPRVAFIGETGYKTLEEAINAAQTGETVTIKVDGTYKLPQIDKNLTIKAAEGVVATFDDIGAHKTGSGSITFENLIFDYYPNKNYTGLQHSSSLTYNNCTINGQVFLYGTSETFNNCTFHQNSAGNYNVWTYGAVTANFNGCTFNSAGKAMLIYNENGAASTVNVSGCTFNATAPATDKAAIEIDSSLLKDGKKFTVNISNSTATGFDNGNISGNSLWNEKQNCEFATVNLNGEQVWPRYVAYIGDQGYTSVEAALDAVQSGEEVIINAGEYTMVKNSFNLPDNVKITGNGEVTLKNALSLTANGIYMKDVNINAGSESALKITGNGTFENCDLTGGNGTRYCYANNGNVTFKNCVVTGSTYGIHFDGGNGDGNVIIDGCTITGWTSFGTAVEKLEIKNTTFSTGNYPMLRFYQNAEVSNCTFPAGTYPNGMRIDSGNKGAGMEGITMNFNGCKLSDGNEISSAFPAEVITASNVILDGVTLVNTGDDMVNAATENVMLTDDVILEASKSINKNINGNSNLIMGKTGNETLTAAGTLVITNLGTNKVGATLGAGDSITFDGNGNMKIEPAYDSNAGYGAVEVTYMKNGKLATETFALKKDAYLSMTKDGILTVVGGDDNATTLPYTLKPYMNEYTFVQYSSATLTYVSNMFFDTFDEAYLDGMKLVPSKDFIAAPGNTYITLTNAKLRTLRLGDHSLYIVGKDGIRSEIAVVRVIASPYVADTSNPKTGDSILLALSVMLFTGCALAVIPFTLKKKTH